MGDKPIGIGSVPYFINEIVQIGVKLYWFCTDLEEIHH